jgi:uncharacterized protein GlcG (DUF336 family)
MKKIILAAMAALACSNLALAADCRGLPTWKETKAALTKARSQSNGGLNLDMWGTVVNRDGQVCAVVYTGSARGDQWPGSRVISAQKAYTANAFSLPKLALSTANLYSAVQPGGSLYGLQFSNPVDANMAYYGDAANFGASNDPMVGKRVGGVNVFGGGLALYNGQGQLVGAIGVSGDTSCADHNIAWRARKELKLDYVPAGVGSNGDDNVMYLGKGEAANGYKHPGCGGKESEVELPGISKAVKTASSQ